jgi:hypothetical protein
MRRLLRDHGLSIAMFGLFFVFVCGQSVMGLLDYNSTQQEHERPPVGAGKGEISPSVVGVHGHKRPHRQSGGEKA